MRPLSSDDAGRVYVMNGLSKENADLIAQDFIAEGASVEIEPEPNGVFTVRGRFGGADSSAARTSKRWSQKR